MKTKRSDIQTASVSSDDRIVSVLQLISETDVMRIPVGT